MSAPLARTIRFAALATCVAASGAVHAASFTLDIPPDNPRTYAFPQCASFTWSNGLLTCVLKTGSPTPPITPPDPGPPTTPGAAFQGCPSNALMINVPWGTTALNTFDYGYFAANILSLRVVVPVTATGTKTRTSSWVEYGSGAVVREAVLSTKACDFTAQYALKTSNGSAARSQDTISFSFKYTIGPPSTYVVHLEPGQEYYLNVRNRYGDGSLSCPTQEACSMRGGFPP
jgi:hypothetical protein